jgi:IS5 family transposase
LAWTLETSVDACLNFWFPAHDRHKKVRYEGLAKNEAQLFSLFGLANLVIAKRSLLDLQARGAS